MSDNIIGKRIKERREILGLSAIDVALLANMARGSIYRYETDRAENITIKALVPLATVLKTTPDYLMGWTDYPEIIDRNISYDKVLECIRECGWTVYDTEEELNGSGYRMTIEYFNTDKKSYVEYITFMQKNGEDVISAVENRARCFDAEEYVVSSYSSRGKYGYSMSIRKLLEDGDEFKYLLEKLAYRLRRLNIPMSSLEWYRINRKEFNESLNACLCYKSVDSCIEAPTKELYESVMKYTLDICRNSGDDMKISTISAFLAKSIADGQFSLEEMNRTDLADMLEIIRNSIKSDK